MIGLEPTFEQHLENLVAVFREVRRVLRQDAVLFLNYGDAYTSGNRSTQMGNVGGNLGGGQHGDMVGMGRPLTPPGLKPKDLMMMPARVALALQADGWWVRSEIVWHKPNPMPESVTDRPTSAHEKVYLLTKSARYFYDAEAVRTAFSGNTDVGRAGGAMAPRMKGTDDEVFNRHQDFARNGIEASGANLRNVWTIPTQGVSAAHFATFPEKLVEPCILAGTSAEGACEQCGAPWERVVETTLHERQSGGAPSMRETGQRWPNMERRTATTGWKPTCECEAAKVPCTVLDPFVGSGTVCRVATRLNRRGIGCDLGYQEIAQRRTTNVQRMLV